jgi:hypothetical protein
VTAVVFKSRLDQLKTNIRNGKYFDGLGITYIFHLIEYQYRGLPHAHMVICLDDAHDIDDANRDILIDFVNRNFVAEMPCFEGEEHQNIYAKDGYPDFTDECQEMAVKAVHMNNTHKCATAINGCKKDAASMGTVAMKSSQKHTSTRLQIGLYIDEGQTKTC